MGTAAENTDNAPIAFLLVICAGLSTGIGAAFVFNTRLVSYVAPSLAYLCHQTIPFLTKRNQAKPLAHRLPQAGSGTLTNSCNTGSLNSADSNFVVSVHTVPGTRSQRYEVLSSSSIYQVLMTASMRFHRNTRSKLPPPSLLLFLNNIVLDPPAASLA